jgi:hypothetical protein
MRVNGLDRFGRIVRPQGMASPLFVPAILFILVLTLFGDVLFSGHHLVVSNHETDLAQAFAAMRQFGYEQLRHGHIPLWNPHVLGGTPFVGNWQSAMFYPPNWIYLLLPLDKALNGEVVLHVFLTGWFMALWAKRYVRHPFACLLAGTMVMFGGPYFLHLYAGHVASLDAMAWTPLILLAVDSILDRPTLKWVLIAIMACAMQLLAGHPQMVFITLVTALVTIGLRLPKTQHRLRALAALAVVAISTLSMTAVQLLTGLQTSAESTRHGAVPYAFAATFSFPPENLLTSIVPTFFGDMIRSPYLGRWYLWEASLSMGITGLVLALYGAVYTLGELPKRVATGPRPTGAKSGSEQETGAQSDDIAPESRRKGSPSAVERSILLQEAARRQRPLVIMAVILLLLTLGAYTPLFRLLYDFAPGFNKFRGHSRFNYPLSLFIALLAACGYDRLLMPLKVKSRRQPATAVFASLLSLAALLFADLGLYLRSTSGTIGDGGLWDQIMTGIVTTDETTAPNAMYMDVQAINQARHFAGAQCLIAAGLMLLLAVCFYVLPARRGLRHAFVVLGVLETFLFARSTLQAFDLAGLHSPVFDGFVATHPGDYRVMAGGFMPNIATISNAYDLQGYDPVVLGRYAQWMAFVQGKDPDNATEMPTITTGSPLLQMLRCQYFFVPTGGIEHVVTYPHPLPHLLLVNRWTQIKSRDAIFAAMSAADFDPRQTVILETPPVPLPGDAAGEGTARLVASSSDTLTIEANLSHPAILLVTDVYSSGWRAVALPGSSQRSYQVMPANYVLRAIPLAAGKHLLRLEYSPTAYRVGFWVSLVSTLVYLMLVCVYLVPWHWSPRNSAGHTTSIGGCLQ